jgi:hypothetical protein
VPRGYEILDYEGEESPTLSDWLDFQVHQPIYDETGEVPGCYRTAVPKCPDEVDPE